MDGQDVCKSQEKNLWGTLRDWRVHPLAFKWENPGVMLHTPGAGLPLKAYGEEDLTTWLTDLGEATDSLQKTLYLYDSIN